MKKYLFVLMLIILASCDINTQTGNDNDDDVDSMFYYQEIKLTIIDSENNYLKTKTYTTTDDSVRVETINVYREYTDTVIHIKYLVKYLNRVNTAFLGKINLTETAERDNYDVDSIYE